MIRAGLVRRLSILGQIIICKNDDIDAGVLGPYFLRQFKAIFPGQSEVRKDGIGGQRLYFLQRLVSVRRFENVDCRQSGLKDLFNKSPEMGIVLNKEDAFHVRPD
jgi:hypothetical protein